MAVQVDPMKSTLKAPGSKRLKLEQEKLLQNFDFKFNLRRHNKGCTNEAGRCMLTPGLPLVYPRLASARLTKHDVVILSTR
jgi:hypothetical protein